MELPICFKLQDQAVNHAKQLLDSKEQSMSSEVRKILESSVEMCSVELPNMIKIFEWECGKSKISCEDAESCLSALPLIENASMVLPHLQKREPNPELQKRLKVLAAQQANKEYNKMVENVSTTKEHSFKPRKSKSTTGMIGGLNFALTLFASCGATVYLLKNVVPDLGVRVGIGIAVGTIILVIEIFLAVREIEKQQKVE